MQEGGGDLAPANQACVTLAALAGLAAPALVALFLSLRSLDQMLASLAHARQQTEKRIPASAQKVTSSPLEC
jgi:hypothetical protein